MVEFFFLYLIAWFITRFTSRTVFIAHHGRADYHGHKILPKNGKFNVPFCTTGTDRIIEGVMRKRNTQTSASCILRPGSPYLTL